MGAIALGLSFQSCQRERMLRSPAYAAATHKAATSTHPKLGQRQKRKRNKNTGGRGPSPAATQHTSSSDSKSSS